MNEADLEIIKKKSLSGVIALTSRTFILQVISFTATFILTVLLSPDIFGVFYIVSAVISFLTYFSDIGLAAALIQKKEEISRDDLQTTFTIQQLLVVTIVIIVFSAAPYISDFYQLSADGLVLLRALSVAFFLSSLKTIPTVLLERQLNFKLLIIPQITETLAFYLVAVFLAYRHFGIASFSWAVLARAVTGLIAIYAVSPWKIRIGISRPVAKRLLKYGVPFQLNSLLALVKDDLMTIFLGKILPFAEIGYIGWAKKWAEVPLRLVVDSVVKVTFPAFSRIQNSKAVLGLAIERTIFGLAFSIFPVMCMIIIFSRPFVVVVPRYAKWEPALISLTAFALASAVSSLSVPLTNTLNAVGRIKTTLGLMVMWTILTWVLTLVGISLFGFNGVAIASLALTITVVVVVELVKKIAPFSFFRAIKGPLVAVFVQAVFYHFSLPFLPGTAIAQLLLAIFGVIIYLAVIWIAWKEQIKLIIEGFKESLWQN
jgi:O-antigen/teichoic acid export membrane protein